MTNSDNITTFSNLEIVPNADDPNSPDNGFYLPSLSQEQINHIPATEDRVGCLVFNTDTQELQYFSPALQWVDVATAGGDGNFVNLNVSNSTNLNTLSVIGNAEINILDVVTALTVAGDTTTTNLNVTNTATINEGDFVNINVSDTATINNANIFSLYVSEAAHMVALEVDGGINAGNVDTQTLEVETSARIQNLQIGTASNQGTLFGVSPVPSQDSGITVTLGVGAGVGFGATVTMSGSPMSGQLEITTGSTVSTGTIATFAMPNTFWQAYSANFGFSFTEADTQTRADCQGAVVTTHSLNLSNPGVPARIRMTDGGGTSLNTNRTYKWNYLIIGNIYGTV